MINKIKRVVNDEPRPSQSLALRNNNLENRNSTSVSTNEESEATRKLREVLNKLSQIATAIAQHFNWDKDLVFADLVSDLQILNNPAKLSELEDNPINQMTKEIMSHYLASPEEFDLMRNQAVDMIMNMSNSEAVRRLSLLIRQGVLGNPERYNNLIGNTNNTRRLTTTEDAFEEDTEDVRITDDQAEERFKEIYGENALIRFKALKQRMTAPDNDVSAWNREQDPEALKEYLDEIQFYGIEPIAENEYYAVFEIHDRETGQRLEGNRNKWCIFKPAGWQQYAPYLERGLREFVYISKLNPEEKYCLASLGGQSEIVDRNDDEIASLPNNVPEVPGIRTTSSVVTENTSAAEAMLNTLKQRIDSFGDNYMQELFDDLFAEHGEDIYDYEGEELKRIVLATIDETDTKDLKEYLESHFEEFSGLRL